MADPRDEEQPQYTLYRTRPRLFRRRAPVLQSLLVGEGPSPDRVAVEAALAQLPTDQRVVVAPLAEIAEAASELEPPALVVVGEVVRYASLDAAQMLTSLSVA